MKALKHSLESEQGGDFYLGREHVAAVQVGEIAQEVDVDLLGLHRLHQLIGSKHRAARGEQVVVDDHHVFGSDGVTVDLDGVGAILLGV